MANFLRRFRRSTYALFTVICVLIVGAPMVATAADLNTKYTFTIPSQSLSSALLTFSEQAKIQVMTASADLAGVKSPGVSGDRTAREALDALLQGTGLKFRSVAADAIAIEPTGAHRASAPSTTSMSGSRNGYTRLAQADDRSSSSVSVATSESASQERIELEEIIVTGTRLAGRSVGPSPVVVMDREAIDRLGVNNVAAVVDYLPQQSFATGEGDNVAASRAIQLRGLGLGTTLILINGRRVVPSAITGARNYFDLNTVPLAAVKRVEVLSDSASAVYGADAVGGVVNIILKDGIDAPALDLYYGAAAGGAKEQRASLAFGHESSRLSGSVVLDYFLRDFLLGEERDLFANRDYRRFGGADLRGATTNPGNITSLTSANLPGLPSRFAAVPVGSTGIGLTPADFLETAGQRNLESLERYSSIVPRSERFSAVALGEFSILPELCLFGEVMYVERVDETHRLPATLANRAVPASNPFNPFDVPVSVNYLFSGIGPRIVEYQSNVFRAVAGGRGDIGTWDWELSALTFQDDGVERQFNNVDTARVNAALAATDPNLALNVFQDGLGGSSTLLQSLVADTPPNDYSSIGNQVSGFVRGSLFELPGGAVDFVVGGEARKEELSFNSRTTASQFFADRQTWSVFAESRVPLIGDEMNVPAVNDLTLTLAGRLDSYNDFGETFNPQAGLQWQLTQAVLVRASYGSSFRAPSLLELYQAPASFASSTPDPRRNNEISPFTLTHSGNPDLEPEESTSWSFGFLYDDARSDGLRVGVTYWRIDQEQRVARFDPALLLANESSFPSFIERGTPSPADVAAGRPGPLIAISSINLNFGALETDGVDFELSTEVPFLGGELRSRLAATWISSYVAADFPNTTPVDRVAIGNSQGTIPEWRATSSLTWTQGGFSTTATARYVSGFRDTDRFNVPSGRRLDGQILADMQTTFDLSSASAGGAEWRNDLQVRFGVINVFDQEPRFSARSGGYDPSQADLRQRFAYAALSKRF